MASVFRTVHYPHVLDRTARADWFEVISENFMIAGGRPLQILEGRPARSRRFVFHGVSLNIGGTDPLSQDYLAELASLIRRFAQRRGSPIIFVGEQSADALPTISCRCPILKKSCGMSLPGSAEFRTDLNAVFWSRMFPAT